MPMSTFMMFCIGMIALGIWIGIGFLAAVLVQVWRAARAVEVLAYKMDDGMNKVYNATQKFSSFADTVRSGWMRAIELAVAAVATTLRSNNSNSSKSSEEPAHAEEREEKV